MVETHFHEGGLAVASGGPILITKIGDDVTLAYLRAAKEAGRRLAKRHGTIASLTLMVPGAPMPNATVRAQAQRDTAESAQWLAAGATVVRESGFRASVTRSIILGIAALSDGPPRKVFQETTGAVDWIGTYLSVPPGVRDAIAAWSDEV